MEWILVGLGNPGEKYVGTRHNIGRDIVADITDTLPKKTKIITPEVFMNDSGKAVRPFVKSVKAAERLVVLHDDLDLPVGAVRISYGRGSAGHKGVESIQKAIKTKNFVRIRIGISGGTAKKVKKPDVLGKFRASDEKALKTVQKNVREAIDILIEKGLGKAMSEINGR